MAMSLIHPPFESDQLGLAGTLNPGEPIKEPQAYGRRDIENHLSEFYLPLWILSNFGHGSHLLFK